MKRILVLGGIVVLVAGLIAVVVLNPGEVDFRPTHIHSFRPVLGVLLVGAFGAGALLALFGGSVRRMSAALANWRTRREARLAAQAGEWHRTGEQLAWDGEIATVRVGERRYLQVGPAAQMTAEPNAPEAEWTLQEIRAGRPFISAATQDQFVPQMVNLEKLGAVDFQKGCYPGQEIVARAQYRGQVKRRMVHLRAPAGSDLRPGQEFEGGTVVDRAGDELLAVMPV